MAKQRESISERLDQTVIDMALLDAIERGLKKKKKSYFDVIIEVNLVHPQGREKARRQARLLLRKVLEEPKVKRGKKCGIRETKSRYSLRYIFAHLHFEQIRALTTEQAALPERKKRPIYKIWLDEEVQGLLTKSVRTVKADAALAAFSAAGENVVWAVVDSGIQGDHIHFRQFGNLDLKRFEPVRHADFSGDEEPNTTPAEEPPEVEAQDPEDLVDPFGHGTHVAGIIAGGVDQEYLEGSVYAARRVRDEEGEAQVEARSLKSIHGVAPRCKLVNLRVLDDRGKGKVSNIIAALGLIQDINNHGRFLHIHGVNLSVGYEFDAESYGCGQSPLCVAVNRLVRSGVVVVAAAGNTGYGRVAAATGAFPRGFKTSLAVTINDPGNADLAITVGATHREKPHLYGVSYFSSRGPTADGRLKPDLVAPGERIISCAAGSSRKDAEKKLSDGKLCDYREESGTSMATEADELLAELAELEEDEFFDAENAAAVLAEARELVGGLEDDPEAAGRLAERLRGLVTAVEDDEDGEDDDATADEDFLSLSGEEMVDFLSGSVVDEDDGSQDGGGAAGAAGGGGGVFDALFGSAVSGVRKVLNVTTFFQMKKRARRVGERGLNETLVALRETRPDLRLHLVGHSFGALLVSAATNGPKGQSDLKVDSVSLLQGAFSHNAFAEDFRGDRDGRLRPVMTDSRVRGPVLATHTKNDQAVKLPYALANRLSRADAVAIGDADDRFGAIGSNGAQSTPEVGTSEDTLKAPGESYEFVPGKVYNLLADAHISKHGGHGSGVRGPAVANAILEAARKRT